MSNSRAVSLRGGGGVERIVMDAGEFAAEDVANGNDIEASQ